MDLAWRGAFLFVHAFVMFTMLSHCGLLLWQASDSPAPIERKVQKMTNLIQALSTALARLATLEEIVARIDKLEERVQRIGIETHDQISVNHDYGIRIQTLEERTLDDPEFERVLERVNILESDVRCLETGDDLDTQIEAVVERVLDRVLEDTLDSALSGREITVTL